jgi:hypothetical protein
MGTPDSSLLLPQAKLAPFNSGSASMVIVPNIFTGSDMRFDLNQVQFVAVAGGGG